MYLDISGMIMFQKHLRKDFSRALSKATLIVMLPLTLAATPLAAQETSPSAPAAPAATTEQVQTSTPAAADTSANNGNIILTEGNVVTVLPEQESNLDDLEKRYPVLKPILSDVRSYNEEFKDTPTKVMLTTVRDTAQKVDLLFVSVQGPLTCGASECQMNIFADNGDGYKQISAGPSPLPVQVLKEKGEISLYFCSTEAGRAQWVLKGGELQHVGIVRQPQSGPTCPEPAAEPAPAGPK